MRGGGSEFETGKSNLLPAESELELGLGLSIGGGAWRERGRILTAKDFPSVGSKRAADQSSSHQGQGASPPRSRFRLLINKAHNFWFISVLHDLNMLLSRNIICVSFCYNQTSLYITRNVAKVISF